MGMDIEEELAFSAFHSISAFAMLDSLLCMET